MKIPENKKLVQSYYDKLWNRWNFDAADTLLTPDFRFRGSLSVTVEGRDGFRGYVRLVREAFPDFHNQVEEIIAEGAKVAARLTYTGTHQGSLFGFPPTGKRIAYAGAAIFTCRGGMLAEGWVLGDTLGLMRQLGISSTAGWGEASTAWM